MNTFDVGVLDLAKQRNDEPARVILRRGDKNATTITATITDHGDPADTTGLSARFSMRLPDMAHYYSKAATLDGNAVSITINEEQAASTVGKTSIAFFELLDASGNLIASTSAFDVIVLMGATDGTGIGESYSDELEEAMQQLADARADYEEMREGAGEAIDVANAAASTASAAASIATAAASSATSAAANANQAASDIRAAAERGDFDGFSPVVDIDDGASSHTITITDREGDHSYTVPTYAAEESARAEAEQGRVTAETARAVAESARATAEQGRVTAEQSRATAETARASAESVRVTAEQGRASAENARASAESARVSAESARASAETSRANAETARSNAESARASEWATIKAEAQDTISAAEDATDAAESAASDATAAAAEARAASAATWLSGNVLFGELSEAAVLTADDAYAAPPESVEVYGKSTQAGTPTPSSPVSILSVDALTLHASADGTTDYTNWPVQIPLSNHIARSLPDGTRDALTLSYQGPSTEHDGWGVFGAELVQRVGHIVANSDSGISVNAYGDGVIILNVLDGAMERARGYCTHLPIGPRSGVVPTTGAVWIGVNNHNVYLVHFLTAAGLADIDAFRTWWQTNTIIIDYPLATPITTDLGTVELPILPNPLTAWADGGSAQPTMGMEYERALSIVIPRIEAAISDLATS